MRERTRREELLAENEREERTKRGERRKMELFSSATITRHRSAQCDHDDVNRHLPSLQLTSG